MLIWKKTSISCLKYHQYHLKVVIETRTRPWEGYKIKNWNLKPLKKCFLLRKRFRIISWLGKVGEMKIYAFQSSLFWTSQIYSLQMLLIIWTWLWRILKFHIYNSGISRMLHGKVIVHEAWIHFNAWKKCIKIKFLGIKTTWSYFFLQHIKLERNATV